MSRYTVEIDGRRVAIVGPGGAEVLARTWPTQEEAATFASTVRQHLGWLSEERFREYYRLGEDTRARGAFEEG